MPLFKESLSSELRPLVNIYVAPAGRFLPLEMEYIQQLDVIMDFLPPLENHQSFIVHHFWSRRISNLICSI